MPIILKVNTLIFNALIFILFFFSANTSLIYNCKKIKVEFEKQDACSNTRIIDYTINN